MIRVAVGVLQRDDGRALLMQRLPGTFREGQWEFPGGKIEAGEDSFPALVRELHEELGLPCLQLQVLVFLLVSEGHYVVEYAYEESRCLEGAQHHLIRDLNHLVS